jgi:hypothetical protein
MAVYGDLAACPVAGYNKNSSDLAGFLQNQ